ncbi:MAG: NUDIX domain-containing protein [Planctomycetota bacterium]|nr:NUDIX domain-containing protein [Planctomycetota bacterium]
MQEDPWVTDRVPLGLVEERWEALCRDNPRYFDGDTLQVLGVVRNGHGGVTIHVAPTSYRQYAVQRTGIDTGTRALGVKGLCRTSEGGWLMGKRSSEVAFYPDQWEFVPGGSVDAGRTPADSILGELSEESGWVAVGSPRAVAVLYDPSAFSWEIVYLMDVQPGTVPPSEAWEYASIESIPAGREPAPLSAVAKQMMRIRDGVTHERA